MREGAGQHRGLATVALTSAGTCMDQRCEGAPAGQAGGRAARAATSTLPASRGAWGNSRGAGSALLPSRVAGRRVGSGNPPRDSRSISQDLDFLGAWIFPCPSRLPLPILPWDCLLHSGRSHLTEGQLFPNLFPIKPALLQKPGGSCGCSLSIRFPHLNPPPDDDSSKGTYWSISVLGKFPVVSLLVLTSDPRGKS